MNLNSNEMLSLFKKLFITISLLILYRFGSYVPVPGLNVSSIISFLGGDKAGGFFDTFHMLSGGAFGRMTIFALSVMPYVLSSIIFQLLSTTFKNLKEWIDNDQGNKKKISFYVKLIMIFICLLQGSGIVFGVDGAMRLLPGSISLFLQSFVTISTFMAGTLTLVWIGDQISSRGIGNGISIIIFIGIISEFPNLFNSLFELNKVSYLGGFALFFIILSFFILLFFIIFVEKSYLYIPVQYPRRNSNIYSNNFSYIPLKVNISGVIPPIFASTALMLPMTIARFYSNNISDFIIYYFSPGKFLYLICNCILIFIFSFFYSGFILDTDDISYNLKKNGGLIPGKRPGNNTKIYIKNIINRLNFIGSIYLSLICLIPDIFKSLYTSFLISGTGALIIIGVVLDTTSHLKSYLLDRGSYDKFMSKISKFRC
ncbi:MAG: preprotein translocase subunit SecY [Anaplasmataceae bacterium]|nr:preprotein translocase subunit SecY [Anaplasmataceae bacterium]